MHLKNIAAGKGKGKKWTIAPHGPMRNDDVLTLTEIIKSLGYADKTLEAKKIIKAGKVLVDGKPCKDHAFGVGLMAIVSIPDLNKSYRVYPKKNKIELVEIKEKDAKTKLCRVIGKRLIEGGKLQVNLHDGSNILYDKPVKVNDTVILSLPDRKITDVLSCAVGNQAMIVSGRHRGEIGQINEILEATATRKSLTTINEIQTLTDYAFMVGTNKSLVE